MQQKQHCERQTTCRRGCHGESAVSRGKIQWNDIGGAMGRRASPEVNASMQGEARKAPVRVMGFRSI